MGNLCTFRKCLKLMNKITVKPESVTGVNLWINTKQVGYIGVFDEPSVKDLLSQVIELIGINSSLDSDGVVSLFTYDFVQHFGEPPNTFVIWSKYHSCGKRSSLRIWRVTLLYLIKYKLNNHIYF